MNNCEITIWGRAFTLDVIYDCYPGEEVLDSQKDAFTMLQNGAAEIAVSLEAVKNYVYETSSNQLKEEKIENIFKYVMPRSIFIPHTEESCIAAILCDYKFEMEHGIAVVFENGKFKEIGTQDIVL